MKTKGEINDLIISTMEKEIEPIIASHGGRIIVKSIEDGIVTIALLGNCNKCPSAQITTEEVVKERLMEKFKDYIKDVRLYSDIDDELWEYAKKILRGEDCELER